MRMAVDSHGGACFLTNAPGACGAVSQTRPTKDCVAIKIPVLRPNGPRGHSFDRQGSIGNLSPQFARDCPDFPEPPRLSVPFTSQKCPGFDAEVSGMLRWWLPLRRAPLSAWSEEVLAASGLTRSLPSPDVTSS